ncbi:MAG: YmdB family metallophosphoesterase [Ruminococcaceae bacterium]|nr:YmdB family metallophosphoesterase [Oscillospiraceae bacterium]
MKILAIGDIVGVRAIEHLKQNLWGIRRKLGIDFVVANGENATEIHGLSASDAQKILDSGVDLITMGNHTWSKRDLYNFLDDNSDKIIRPANYPGNAPGCSYTTVDVGGYRLLCMNVQGVAFMDPLADPFEAVEYILAREEGEYDLSLLDFHAEATSEKYAMARVFDGKISMIFGTHTHVATADCQILPGGTAYVTDLGMTGPVNGILGTDSERVLRKMRMHMPSQFIVADGEIKSDAVIFETDGEKMTKISRIRF